MPRRRMIDPTIWKDPDFAKLTIEERLLFIGMISNADDEGRILATPASLKADIFPYDHRISPVRVKKLRDGCCEKMKNVFSYQNGHVEFIQLLRWDEYQKPPHPRPSKLPAPTIGSNVESQTSSPTSLPTSSQTSSPTSLPTSSRPSIGEGSGDPLREDNKLSSLRGASTFSALIGSLKKEKNKVGVLVDAFRAYHANAPPEDFDKLGGRIAGLLKQAHDDYGYLGKLIWETAAADIAGSHLGYIQGRLRRESTRGPPKLGAKLSSDEEIARSIK